VTRQRILFSITIGNETVNFVERSQGSKGRDILAIKIALGMITSALSVENSSPQDFSIGKSWFDCESGQEVSSTMGIVFDEKMKSRLMSYQIQNQFVILSYYFEKYLIRKVETKEDLLSQMINADQIFASELGNIGEGTLATLHGWVPSSDLTNQGFYIDSEVPQQVPMFLYESLKSGNINLPERIKAFFGPFPDSQEDRSTIQMMKRDFQRFFRSYRDIENKINEVVGWAIYNQPSEESSLYSGASQVIQKLSEELSLSESLQSRKEINSLSLRALEPNHLTDPDPFIINQEKIGIFHRTQYTLESLPPVLDSSQVSVIKTTALLEALEYFSKSMGSQYTLDEIIEFIDLRTPSLRPGDVYRAYLEIDKKIFDTLPEDDEVNSQLSMSQNANIIADKLDANIETLEKFYCSLGTDIDEEQSRLQYQKYRAYATKNKREIVRELRAAAARASQNQQNIGNNFIADLGPFGQIDLSDTRFINGITNEFFGLFPSFDPSESDSPLKIRYNDLVNQLENTYEQFIKADPDVQKYKFKDGNGVPISFSAQEEANKIQQIKPAIDTIINDNKEVKQLSKNLRTSIRDLVKKGSWGGFASAELQFDFSYQDKPRGSSLDRIILKVEDAQNIVIYQVTDGEPPPSVPSIFFNERTMHYLRHINDLGGLGAGFGAICEDDTYSQAGLGAAYVLRYTKFLSEDRQIDYYNPFHDPTEPAGLEIERFVEQTKRSRTGILDSFIAPTAYGVSDVLPLIGDDCDFDDLKQFVSTRQLEKYVCDYISCLRLPAFNLKIPNIDFRLPDANNLPTFRWPGFMENLSFLELLKEIATRLVCRFVNLILDVLKTPFCGDQIIEDLYGASSNQSDPSSNPAVRQALADALVDVGVPNSMFDKLSSFMSDLVRLLTPRELCALLEGEAIPQEVINIIKRTASKNEISEYLREDNDIYRMFASLGAFLDPQFCEDLNSINEALIQYSCDKPSDVISQIRNRILRNEDVTDEDIERATNLAEKNYEDKAKQLEALFSQNGLEAAFPEIIYGPGNPDALINELPDAVLESAQEMATTIFEAPKMSYISSLKSFVPAMYLNVPSTAEPGDPNYNESATLQVQRLSENLRRYAASSPASDADIDDGDRFFLLTKRLTYLYYDYERDETLLADGTSVFSYKTYQVDSSLRLIPITLTDESRAIYDDATAAINFQEMLPIRLSKPFNEKLTITTEDEFVSFISNREDPVTAAFDVQSKIDERLQEIRTIIENNIDKAFNVTNKSEFLLVLKDFYDSALERAREGTPAELIDFIDEENTLFLRQPQGLAFNSNILMKDKKFEGNKLPYTISVNDDFFLGGAAGRDFSYCDEIPEEFLTYDRVSGNLYPRRQLFAEIYIQNLKEKVQEYAPAETDLEALGLSPEVNSNFMEKIYEKLYAATAEGVTEQLRDYISNSRLFSDPDYVERVDRVVRGFAYLDKKTGCIKNRFNLIGKSELDFDKIIVFDFMQEFQRELGRPENSALSIDPGKQGPVELSVANVTAKAFIRLCILEIILKSAATLSVWDLEYIVSDEFFNDYVFEFVNLEVERKISRQNKEQFDDAIFRVTGISNRYLAMKSLVKTELATFVSLSKSIYDHDPDLDHSDWYLDILPLTNVPEVLSDTPTYDGQFVHSLEGTEVPSLYNAFNHLERYLRIEGPMANVESLVRNQYEAALSQVSIILEKLRDTNFDGPQMPNLQDYLLTGEEEIFTPLTDSDRTRELLSPEEFKFLLEEVLSGNAEMDRYLSDLLNLIGPDQTSDQSFFGKPKAIHRTPVRAIRRKRKIIAISDEDLITSNRGTLFDNFFEELSFDAETITRISTQFSNSSEEEDRFYIIPVNGIESDFASSQAEITDLDSFIQDNTEGTADIFKENFLIQKKSQTIFPEMVDGGILWTGTDKIDQEGQRGYTLSKIRAKSGDQRLPDQMHDPLDPSAPWNLFKRNSDIIARYTGQGPQDPYATEEALFVNNYGEVTEEIWNTHFEQVEGVQDETWQETVIDLTLDASPVFSIVGESKDPLVGQSLGIGTTYDIQNVLEHLELGERRSLIQEQEGKTGPGFTFVLDSFDAAGLGEFTGDPKLGDSFGYKKSFDYREETLYNNFEAIKDNGNWTIGEQELLKRNDYKVPVRILITQVLDSDDNVTSCHARVVVPEILDFNNREMDSVRRERLVNSFKTICRDFIESINTTYESIKEDEDHNEEERQRLFVPEERYKFVKQKVPDFPVFCRTNENKLPTGRSTRNSVMSISKLYSVACQQEAVLSEGNFSLEQTKIDELFAKDRGMLVKRNQGFLENYANTRFKTFNAAADYTGIDYGDDADNLTDEVTPNIVRQSWLEYTNLYDLGGAHNIDLGLSTVQLAKSVSNIITSFQQRRSDAFWGHTYAVDNVSSLEYDLVNYGSTNEILNTETGVTVQYTPPQVPFEEFFFKSGLSPFVSDNRTYDFQFMELLYSVVSYLEDGGEENVDDYNVFLEYLIQFQFKINQAVARLKRIYGENFEQDTDYIENFTGFSNELGPTITELQKHIQDMVDYHGQFDKPAVVGQSPGYVPDFTHYRNIIIKINSPANEASGLRKKIISGARLSHYGEVFTPLNISELQNENNIVLSTGYRKLAEMQYQNMQAVRSSRQNINLRYNAALGADGLNVLEGMLDILSSYQTVDEDGNTVISSIIKDTKIVQGLRLMHNTPWGNPALGAIGFDLITLGVAEEAIFQNEERCGLLELSTQEGERSNGFTAEIASYEREIESFECWSRGESFLDVFYSMDSFMIDELKKTKKYRAYTELCFPVKKYASMMTVHGCSLLAGYNTMPFVLNPTKDVIASVFGLMTSGTDFENLKFGNAFTNVELRNMIDESISSEGPDECFSAPSLGKWFRIVSEMIEEMIKRFPALVLRGIANQIDPAYKEIKTHWTNCQLDGFSWQGKDSGQIITPVSGISKLSTGVRTPGEKGTYAPVNIAFPVDFVVGGYRLLPFTGDFDPEYMQAAVAKLLEFIGTGNLPLIDPSYAFQIPCKEVDFSGDTMFSEYLDKFDIGAYGRYGHPATIFTALALSTPVLPGDRRQKIQRCEVNNQSEPPTYCEDDEE